MKEFLMTTIARIEEEGSNHPARYNMIMKHGMATGRRRKTVV